jgi:hypothetical protein
MQADRNLSVPRYEHTADELRRATASGVLVPGPVLPARAPASRGSTGDGGTAPRALDILLNVRRQGRWSLSELPAGRLLQLSFRVSF